MKIKMSEYKASKTIVEGILRNKPTSKRTKLATEIAVSSDMPIAVVLQFILEIEGENAEVRQHMVDILKFYGSELV